MSVYAEYLKEREGKEVVENDNGFLSYRIFNDYVYIVDIYVVPEKRKTGLAKFWADQVCEIAKAKGAKTLVGSVDVRANGATESLKVLLAYGMRVDSIDGQMIYFKKDL